MPAELRRRILVEAGHRCAIPTCRFIEVDVHHIEPYARVQEHTYENLIALCPNCQRRAEKGDIDRKSLRLYKANLRFAHDKYSQFEMDVLFELARCGDDTVLPFPEYLMLLLKRLVDSDYVHLDSADGFAISAGIKTTPDYLRITPKGRAFVEDLARIEIGY